MVLIIDDDPRNVLALKATLVVRNYKVLTASSAKDGIQLMRDHKEVEVVLLDMMMPDMDGYEALSIIRADKELAQLAVVAVTAQAMVGDKEKCLEAGADAYLKKPVDVDELLELINRLIKEK